MLQSIGWVGAMLFAFCSLPQAIQIYQTHSTDDISWLFLIMWFFGEIFTFLYVFVSDLKKKSFQYPLLANYIFNFIILLYIIGAKFFYDKT